MGTVTISGPGVASVVMAGMPHLGSGLYFERLIDWDSLPESKSDVRERPNADGAFGIAFDFRRSAAFSVEGWFLGATRAEALLMRRSLNALFRRAGLTMTVDDDLGPASRGVSVRNVKMSDLRARPYFTVAIDMVAVDPNQYGLVTAPSTGLRVAGTGYAWPATWPAGWGSGGDPGRVSATNSGGATTYPILEVTGGLAGGFELVELVTGSVLRLPRDIPVGGTVFFNTRTGRVYLDVPANDITGDLSRKDWAGFAIPASGTRTIQLNALGVASGAPRLTVRYAPAF